MLGMFQKLAVALVVLDVFHTLLLAGIYLFIRRRTTVETGDLPFRVFSVVYFVGAAMMVVGPLLAAYANWTVHPSEFDRYMLISSSSGNIIVSGLVIIVLSPICGWVARRIRG